MSRTARLLLYAALGPITGPLAAGLTRAIREGRHAMAWVYGLAILEAWAFMGLFGISLIARLGIRVG